MPFLRTMSFPRWLIVIFIVAFGLRLLAALALRDISQPPDGEAFGQDAVRYHYIGAELAAGRAFTWPSGHLASDRAPGFPFYLAALYKMFGVNHAAAYVSFALLGALACLVAAWLTRDLLGEGSGVIAGWLAVFYVPHIYLATLYASENLFIPLMGLALLCQLRHLRRGGWGWLLGAALLLGYATWTRPFVLVLLPLIGIQLIIVQWRRRRLNIPQLLAWGLVIMAIIFTWTWRNHHVHGEFALVTSNGGGTFYGAHNDIAVEDWRNWGDWINPMILPHREEVMQMTEIGRDKAYYRYGFEWIRENPGWMAVLLPAKFFRLWLPDVWSPNALYRMLMLVGYTPYLILLLLGAWALGRHGGCGSAEWWLIHLSIIAVVLTALIFWGAPRFRDAALVSLVPYMTLGLLWMWEKIFGRAPLPAASSSAGATEPD